MRHKGWIVCSGLMWMGIGLWLSWKGIFLIAEGALGPNGNASFSFRYFGHAQEGALALVSAALAIGLIKGRFVLSKTVRRVCLKIVELPLPIRLKEVYSSSYLLLIAGMMLLGLILRVAPIPLDVKGFIDLGVGSALMQGALLYFRAARSLSFS